MQLMNLTISNTYDEALGTYYVAIGFNTDDVLESQRVIRTVLRELWREPNYLPALTEEKKTG